MPNYPSIYLELQELWKRLRKSSTDVSSLESRVSTLEGGIGGGVEPIGPAGGVLRGTYPNPNALGSPDSNNIIDIYPHDTSSSNYILIKALDHDTDGNKLVLLGGNGSNAGGSVGIYGGDGADAGAAYVDSGIGANSVVYIGTENAATVNVGSTEPKVQTINIGTNHQSTINIGAIDEANTQTTIHGDIIVPNVGTIGALNYDVVVKNASTNYLSTVSLETLNSEFTVSTSGNITGSGASGNPITLKNDVTSSNILVTNNITVQGTASIAMLNTINQQSVQVGDKYITIMTGSNNHTDLNGAGILFGSGSSDGTTGDQGSVAYVIYRGVGTDSDYLEAFPGFRVSGSLTASAPSQFTQVTASNFRATALPASSETNVVVVDSNGVLGKTTLSSLGGVGGNFSGILSGAMPNAVALRGIDQTTYSTIPLNANSRDTLKLEVEDRATAPNLILYGGSSTVAPAPGGDVGIVGGDSAAGTLSTGRGGDIVLQGGAAGVASSPFGTSGKGGSIYLVGGTSTDGNGGDIYIQGGDGASGNDGAIYLDVNRPKILNFDLLFPEPNPSIYIGTIEQADTNIRISGSITPSVDDTYYLGHKGDGPNKRWKAVYSSKVETSIINFGQKDLTYYDWGSWTPNFINVDSGSASTTVYGKYCKIGGLVTVWGYIQTDDKSNDLDDTIDAIQIENFPFVGSYEDISVQYTGHLVGVKSGNSHKKGGDIYPIISDFVYNDFPGELYSQRTAVVNKDLNEKYAKLIFTINYMV